MDVVNPCKDASSMVNEVPRVEKPCNACGTIVILTVYGPTNGLWECQKEVGYCYKNLNLKYSTNPSSHGIETYLEGLNDERRGEKTHKPNMKLITRKLMKNHEINTPQKYDKERKSFKRRIPLRITLTCNEANFWIFPSWPSLSLYFLFIRCIFEEVNFN